MIWYTTHREETSKLSHYRTHVVKIFPPMDLRPEFNWTDNSRKDWEATDSFMRVPVDAELPLRFDAKTERVVIWNEDSQGELFLGGRHLEVNQLTESYKQKNKITIYFPNCNSNPVTTISNFVPSRDLTYPTKREIPKSSSTQNWRPTFCSGYPGYVSSLRRGKPPTSLGFTHLHHHHHRLAMRPPIYSARLGTWWSSDPWISHQASATGKTCRVAPFLPFLGV